MYNTPVPQPDPLPLPSDPEEIFDAKFVGWDATLRVAMIEFNKAIRAIALDHIAHSVSSNEISFGEKTFLIETGKGFARGMTVKAVPDADLGQFVLGQVEDYNIDTGVFKMDVEDARGGGNYNNWTITLAVSGGATGGGGNANLRYLETTGTAADYLADLTIPITNYKDGDVFNVKFHVDCVANATLKISGINPALDLKVQASDGVYVNVAAKDIVAGHQCLVRIAGGATMAIIEPATSLEVIAPVVANTTFTLANALDRTIFSNGTLAHTLPLMADFPVNGSFMVVNESGNCTINRQGLDNIKFNGSNVTTLLVPQGGSVLFINRGTDWVAIGSAATSSGFSNIAVFSAPGPFNFNVPNGVGKIKATLIGPGGNGGSATNTSGGSFGSEPTVVTGGSGGGGGVCIGTYNVTPNTVITGVVGAPGGVTSLGSLCSATGGANGQSISSGSNVVGANGAGGMGVGGQINFGQIAGGQTYLGYGLPGASNAAKNGRGYGGGGLGGSAGPFGSSPGGVGAPGLVIIEY